MNVMQAPRRHAETPAERAARIGREADTIAKAHADIDSGLGIEDDAMDAWFDQLERDANARLARLTAADMPWLAKDVDLTPPDGGPETIGPALYMPSDASKR